MLGKLFSTAASSLSPRGATSGSARPTTSLESVQEDNHTRNLLFPDAEALYQHQHDQVFPLSSSAVPLMTSSSNAFDLNPEIEVDLQDVRVVIMQEATSLQNSPALLYDSQPLVEALPPTDRQTPVVNASTAASRSGGGRSIASPRRISLGQASKPVVITHEGSVPRSFGAFDRRPSIHNRAGSYAETEGQRSVREYKEELTTFSNCIFGSSDVMAYKGTGTKVHIIPTETRSSSFPFGDGHGSVGKSSMRSSKLAQSYTSEHIAPPSNPTGLPGSGSGPRSFEKKKVLITRIFPVPLPNSEADVEKGTPGSQIERSDSSGSYPFPAVGSESKAQLGKKPRQKRTPMYAIGLIVQLPASTHLASTPTSRFAFRGPSSYTDQESFPSSFNSQKPWTVLSHGLGVDSLESSVFSDFDDRIDIVTQHWDIIMRTLNHLQAVISESVLSMLKQVDMASPDPANLRAMSSHLRTPAASISVSGKRVEETIKPFKLPGSNAKWVQLLPNALAYQQNIKKEVDSARQRIIMGIKTLQVITRQGRWGIWRDEARWVTKWAGGKEEGFFFYNLLTGFLGNHTEWLRALGPERYRRQHYQQRRATKEEDTAVSARTVIVARDRTAARRLIFLLSAFLPPTQQQNFPFSVTYRPGTAASFDCFSQSPPSFFPAVMREESLRRKVKRRNGPNRNTHSRTMSFQTQASNTSSQLGPGSISVQDAEHRNSDVTSLKTANLPIPGSDGGSKKSSAATTTTVTPATTVPHFSTRRPIRGTGPIPRPGSSGSLAADDLIRSLKRGDSTGHFSNASSDMQANSRWGSMISSFWSTKRRDSTNATDITPPSIQSSEDDTKLEMKKGKLAEMVDEAQKEHKENDCLKVQVNANIPQNADTSLFAAREQPVRVQQIIKQELQPIHPGGAFESPVKTSINEEDGVIEIDVSLPDFITSSFGSTFSSPSSSGYLSTHGFGPGLEGFEHYSRSGSNADAPLNVGGWLPRYHPDFTLQAIPIQEGLEDAIKSSMSAEPTPILNVVEPGETSRWVDVCSTMIADATTFSIKRIRCRRHVMVRIASKNEISNPAFADTRSQSLYGNPYGAAYTEVTQVVIEETFTEDAVISMEETLIDSVERMVSQTGSKPSSSSSSRSGSRMRAREGSDTTARGVPHPGAEEPLKVPEAPLEVPRGQCKKVILGALEDIAREVADSRPEEATGSPDRLQLIGRESMLREGIRNWYASVEDLV